MEPLRGLGWYNDEHGCVGIPGGPMSQPTEQSLIVSDEPERSSCNPPSINRN